MSEAETEPNHWDFVTLEFSNEAGTGGIITSHCPAAELIDLRDQILERLDELENSNPPSDLFEDLDDTGIPDEAVIPRDLSQQIVALFAISTGIMEKQLMDILKSEIIIEDYREEGKIIDTIEERGLKKNLDLARDLGILGDGVYGQVEDVRKTRNDLVHNPTARLSIVSVSSERDRINKTINAPTLLSRVLGEIDPRKRIESSYN